ncbi:MAG: hypothetical protein R2851_26165 [Caldilineaceae bacterium]
MHNNGAHHINEIAVRVENLAKDFTVREKAPGLRGSIRSLWKRTARRAGRADVSFTLPTGEMLAFIGPNGAANRPPSRCSPAFSTRPVVS